ncbi:MAG TPA: hypothetical protein VK760_01495 [Candidatus Acidoferrales bacterium]|jgi:hypothetical protein|nr:hypothetical protein [Candidatus Acidoferrales bacterium]
MPRQIIDTESSRPAYVRRRVTTFVVIGVILACLAVAAWVIFRSHAG